MAMHIVLYCGQQLYETIASGPEQVLEHAACNMCICLETPFHNHNAKGGEVPSRQNLEWVDRRWLQRPAEHILQILYMRSVSNPL